MTSLATSHKVTEGTPAGRGSAAATTPPPWIKPWGGLHPAPAARQIGACTVTIARGASASLITITVPSAANLSPADFEQRSNEIYNTLRATLATLEHSSPVRFWNYLPGIHQPMDERGDRYIVFNAGRFRALTEWFGDRPRLHGRLPTASAVGHSGPDLVVLCLAMAHPCASIENPRQVSAWNYSNRYGKLPPCFARATTVIHPVDGSRALLVGGTASIRGEETVHVGDLAGQLEETFANFESLVAAADSASDLRAFSHVRAYYPQPRDRGQIESAIRAAFGPAVHLEMLRAELCRADLLVEIEGLATLAAGQ